jgi:hypothetical protein
MLWQTPSLIRSPELVGDLLGEVQSLQELHEGFRAPRSLMHTVLRRVDKIVEDLGFARATARTPTSPGGSEPPVLEVETSSEFYRSVAQAIEWRRPLIPHS